MSNLLSNSNWTGLPEFLQSYSALEQNIRAHLHGKTNVEKGRKFAHFVQQLFTQHEWNADFEELVLNSRESNDEGIDLSAKGRDGSSTLYVQSRLTIDRAEDIDLILSKFQNYTKKHHSNDKGQLSLFQNDDNLYFMIVTLSSLEGIMKKYKSYSYSTRNYFSELEAQGRIAIVDGNRTLSILRSGYAKTSDTPTKLELNLETLPIQRGNVYIGVVSAKELQRLYSDFNDSLFFENVREFRGLSDRSDRKSPNQAIMETIQFAPERMLERNNGLVFKAEKIEIGDQPNKLVLTRGGVVNGAQTTMCIVDSSNDTCDVLVKIVQTDDPWIITEAANLQNYVTDIDLTIARTLRTQLAKRAASILGVSINLSANSALQVMSNIYDQKVTYEETRLLYIGLFSQSPTNIFAGNYTELRKDLIALFHKEDKLGLLVYDSLFVLQESTEKGLSRVKKGLSSPDYSKNVERLFSKTNFTYKCFLSILAICATLKVDISERDPDENAEYNRTRKFLENTVSLLRADRKAFLQNFMFACKVWMDEVMPSNATDQEVRQYMSKRTQRSLFSGMLRSIYKEIDTYNMIRSLPDESTD